MKKIGLLTAIIIGCIVLWNYAKPEKITRTIKNIGDQVSSKQIEPQKEKKSFVFIPYWSFTKNIVTDSNDSLIYFGIGVNENGIEPDDDGYKKLDSFVELTPNASEKILAVRMTDKNINASILKNLSVQEKIASSAVSLAMKKGFDGVLLDYETSAFGFDTTTNNIASFFELFEGKVKKSNLLFYVTLYGDTYFRARPYDVKRIGSISDKVVIMAYDFSKSRSNPGPNFPLYDTSAYGYDFGKMVDDFQKDVDNSKLVIALGYFGYDWRVDSDGNAVASGIPLSSLEIKKEFIDDCQYDNCSFNRSPKSFEPSIIYKDDSGDNHVVWFEDAQSADKKKEFLKEKGILQTASWAYSYY